VSTTLAYILGIVILVIGIGVSVALHELGHMIPAKKFGVKVPEYFIGFGPKIWSFKRGETEYGVKAIWLGGYVKLVGMLPPARPGRPGRRRKDGSRGTPEFFRARFYRGAKIRSPLFFAPAGILLGSAFPKPCYAPCRARKEVTDHAKEIQYAPPPSCGKDPHDR